MRSPPGEQVERRRAPQLWRPLVCRPRVFPFLLRSSQGLASGLLLLILTSSRKTRVFGNPVDAPTDRPPYSAHEYAKILNALISTEREEPPSHGGFKLRRLLHIRYFKPQRERKGRHTNTYYSGFMVKQWSESFRWLLCVLPCSCCCACSLGPNRWG